MSLHPIIHPTPLKKGGTIGVIAPSSVYDVSQLTGATEFLEARGFNVVFHEQTKARNHQFAGTPDEKVSAIHDYFKNPDIDAIFCTCGGNGAIHLLDLIDYDLIKQNPKILAQGLLLFMARPYRACKNLIQSGSIK